MNADNLFKLLVVGGALLSAGSTLAGESNVPTPADPVPQFDLAFCSINPPVACEQDEAGRWLVSPGFECCWGTSCRAN